MKRKRAVCGCSFVVAVIDIEDGESFSVEDVAALCPICDANGGDYSKSPYWKHDKLGVQRPKPKGGGEENRDSYPPQKRRSGTQRHHN